MGGTGGGLPEIATLAALAQKDRQRLMSLSPKRHAPVQINCPLLRLPNIAKAIVGEVGGGHT